MLKQVKKLLAPKSSSRIVEYIFIDRVRLKSYIEQLKGPRAFDKIPSWEVGLNLTGPQVKGQQTLNVRPFTDHEMIELLVKHLGKKKQLAVGHPSDHYDGHNGVDFGIEEMTARKAIFQVPERSPIRGLNEIAVWVSNPSPNDLNNSYYSEGTFLYLLESYWNSDEPYKSAFSGFSALSWIIGELAAVSTISKSMAKAMIIDKGNQSNGRYANLHPIEIFEKLGAFVQPTRRIRSLYRKRSISDDQVFKDSNGVLHRSKDLVAYPIFISSI